VIHASCHTADNAMSLEFDATPWFDEADADSILLVAKQGWSSAWIAESLETRPGYQSLHRLIDYAARRLQRESLEDPAWTTFECIVNGAEAMAWLDRNRPEIAAAIRGGSSE
jgi:hypothetical protein